MTNASRLRGKEEEQVWQTEGGGEEGGGRKGFAFGARSRGLRLPGFLKFK